MSPPWPLHSYLTWAPFKIDALGLVTLLGAEDVNKAVGRLVRSRYTTFLPILGGYVIAGDDFTGDRTGYTLYNITDSITTTVVGGWFSRWLDKQPLKAATTVFSWVDLRKTKKMTWMGRFTNSLGIVPLLGLTALTLLVGDFWGLANALSMCASIFVRWFLVNENVLGLDQASHTPGVDPSEDEHVKVLVTSPRGNMVTLYMTRKIVLRCITRKPEPVHGGWYTCVRGVGWCAFGVHIISLGQSCLLSQIYTVVLLVVSTILVVMGWGCDEERVGYRSRLCEVRRAVEGPDRRMWAYACLETSVKEEERMLRWGLLPDRENVGWWAEFERAKVLARGGTEGVVVVGGDDREGANGGGGEEGGEEGDVEGGMGNGGGSVIGSMKGSVGTNTAVLSRASIQIGEREQVEIMEAEKVTPTPYTNVAS